MHARGGIGKLSVLVKTQNLCVSIHVVHVEIVRDLERMGF
jgi:hypothetical protein